MSVIEHDHYFTCLPRHYYVSESIFAEEIEKVWHQQWLYVGHVSQIPSAGDYLTFELLGESVIVTRDEHDEIHALYNMCRHRGTRLCDGASGSVNRFVCPYHAWSYALDGRLLNAARLNETSWFDPADWGLHHAHVEVWQGFIFVSFADEAPDPVAPQVDAANAGALARLEPESLKVAHVRTYPVKADWKVLLENGNECYHCPGVHPEFCRTLDVNGLESYFDDDFTPTMVQGMDVPLKPGAETLSIDGKYVSRLLLGKFGRGLPVPDNFYAGFMTQPGYAWAVFYADHGLITTAYPVAFGRSELVTTWFVREDAQEGSDYDLERLIALWDVTDSQDAAIVNLVQLGLQSRRYTPGPLNRKHEPGIRRGLQGDLDMMGEEHADVRTD